MAFLAYMSKDCAPTIARKILTSRFDDVKERCKASKLVAIDAPWDLVNDNDLNLARLDIGE